ncbi:NADH-quinone oxidoreductase subunit J [Legionella israelensis]|uniref:NADH-quinone oxidoreductase subunit J n=1 Tax=Legionella israelensis TaxID=454 RepID=A0A0W0W9S9_9GAMM|nr:NADH-quinone oxidoreductase subunit J [Legionella israelensis]KTD28742.1 NADH-quinone oxidoreductase chain J [Legionella israelensis]QBR83218.1 NADH-quinone oxidoreductase subunit J [Legionella israelensis]QBS09405.1 NADH-quinone oxidoreductase subunit J [Legionella israelensis]QDP71747.1 NADH-quinone oxidoreductase subunit J [Legionella israelensis]SCX88262.1 NADH dehydrogenase subunit J [Legionella israelensis DSM 19235]
MNELLINAVFYVFAGVTVLSAFMAVTQNNPVRCVLFLVLAFFASSVLWILAEAEFLALILVLVYVGAVMTLFLFVVMMLNIETESVKRHLIRYMPFGLIVVAFLAGLLMVAIPSDAFEEKVEQQPSQQITPSAEMVMDTAVGMETVNKEKISNTEQLGLVLYTDYVLAFELAAVILLVAIISAITLAHRTILRSKRQDILKQLMTRPEDRIDLVNLKPKE